MITIGVDAHKRLHVAVTIDSSGQEIESWRGPNSPARWARLQEWRRVQKLDRGSWDGIMVTYTVASYFIRYAAS